MNMNVEKKLNLGFLFCLFFFSIYVIQGRAGRIGGLHVIQEEGRKERGVHVVRRDGTKGIHVFLPEDAAKHAKEAEEKDANAGKPPNGKGMHVIRRDGTKRIHEFLPSDAAKRARDAKWPNGGTPSKGMHVTRRDEKRIHEFLPSDAAKRAKDARWPNGGTPSKEMHVTRRDGKRIHEFLPSDAAKRAKDAKWLNGGAPTKGMHVTRRDGKRTHEFLPSDAAKRAKDAKWHNGGAPSKGMHVTRRDGKRTHEFLPSDAAKRGKGVPDPTDAIMAEAIAAEGSQFSVAEVGSGAPNKDMHVVRRDGETGIHVFPREMAKGVKNAMGNIGRQFSDKGNVAGGGEPNKGPNVVRGDDTKRTHVIRRGAMQGARFMDGMSNVGSQLKETMGKHLSSSTMGTGGVAPLHKGVHVVRNDGPKRMHVVRRDAGQSVGGKIVNAVKDLGNKVADGTGLGKSTPAAGGSSPVPSKGGSGNFNVKDFGARADGRNDDTQAFTSAWKAACAASGTVTLLVPKGTYLVGPLQFHGPCKAVTSMNFQLQGFLKATTDLNRFAPSGDWVHFGWIDGLTLTGGGTFDGQGSSSWPFNKCPQNKNCKTLPNNIKFVQMTKTTVKSITSLNSKFFHIVLLDCTDFSASGIKISAPSNSPNTDGIHMERSTGVTISDSVIGTGDDCVSMGQGNSHITVEGITCGPGHGISVGSLGRYANEGDVNGLVVKDCTLTGTMNGIRIKTWENSPDSSAATNMTFENIVMNNVGNPIIIDQTYCPYSSCSSAVPSKVKLSDIFFRNIRGTSSSPVAVTLECSKGNPCSNVNLEDIHLDLASGGSKAKSTCQNVQAKYSGTNIPAPCA